MSNKKIVLFFAFIMSNIFISAVDIGDYGQDLMDEGRLINFYASFFKNDDISGFKKVFKKNNLEFYDSFSKILNKAIDLNAHNIFNFLLKSASSDDDTITWLAVYSPDNFDKLIKDFKPRPDTLNKALANLRSPTGHGQYVKMHNKQQYQQAERLLLNASATPNRH